jgi:hypothetical protein
MTKILLKLEDYLAYSTIYQTFIPALLALKLQVRLHKMFPAIFAHILTRQYND